MKKEALGMWEYWPECGPELLFRSVLRDAYRPAPRLSRQLTRRSLLDMAAEEGGAAAEPNVWRGKKVPPGVFAALTAYGEMARAERHSEEAGGGARPVRRDRGPSRR